MVAAASGETGAASTARGPPKPQIPASNSAAMYGAVAESSSLGSSDVRAMKPSNSRSSSHHVPAQHPRSEGQHWQVEPIMDGGMNDESEHGGKAEAFNKPRITRRRKPVGARSNPKLTKAVRFLTNPSVGGLPLDDKIGYLQGKGLTPPEVQEALNMAGLEFDEMDGAWDDDDESDDESDEYARSHRRRGPSAAAGSRRRRRAQQPYQEYQPSPPQSSSYVDNQMMQPYQQDLNLQQHQQVLAEPGLALPLTVGGILGVTAIAAFRWLNGGNFVLFPPPSAPPLTQEASVNATLAGGVKFRAGGTGNETTVDSTIEEGYEEEDGAIQVEEEVDDGNYTTDEQDETIYDYLDEYLGNEEEGGEDGRGAGAGGGVNNDTTYGDEDDRYHTADYTYESGEPLPGGNSKSLPTTNPPDLADRLEDLTAAVEKFVAVQERTLKAKADEKGQAVTNSAMDLLRRSSSVAMATPATPAVTPYRNGEVQVQPQGTPRSIGGDSDGSVPDVAVAVLVTKMKCQLIGVREAIKDAGKSSDGTSMERAEHKLEEVTTTFERLESMLLGGKQVSDYETELPVAANVASMYETPSRMFETGELSPVPGCKDGEDAEVTDLDVTLEMEMSPDRTAFAKEEEQNAIAAAAAAVAGKCRTLRPPAFEVEDLGPTPEEPIGRAALSQAIDILSNASNNNSNSIKTCAQMLYLYVVNLSSNASSKRYRRVYTTNANFKNKVGSVAGGVAVLESLGFVDKGSYMEWEGDIDVPEGTADEDCGIALLNHAAAQLSMLKVTGMRREDGQSVALGAITPRQRCETPAPPGAPPRPTTVSNSDSAGSAGSAGSVATAGTNTATSVASPSGFITPRMRGDGIDRYVASPANSLASTNILASPPVIKQIPSRQDGVADELFGKDQEVKLEETQHEDLNFPPAPTMTKSSQNGRETSANEVNDEGIFRTTRKILPPRAPSRGPPVDNIGDFESIFGVNNGSAFMSRAGSNMSAQSEPNFEAGGLGLSLKLRRSPASEDDAEFAPRRNSDPFSTRVGPSKVSSAPMSASHSPTKDHGKPMYFNLADMAVDNDDRTMRSPGASVDSPGTLDYTASPLNTSLLSGCPDDSTEASTTHITEVGMTPARVASNS
mmetsp:Transcript_1524/g.4418  ORF Transcript_1524/g.4418 Transcript_1524/m.4418 type:complete len:1123 (+) Transcript_1524:216-3584(+)